MVLLNRACKIENSDRILSKHFPPLIVGHEVLYAKYLLFGDVAHLSHMGKVPFWKHMAFSTFNIQ